METQHAGRDYKNWTKLRLKTKCVTLLILTCNVTYDRQRGRRIS
jgi:hypothetical protein